MAILQVCKLEPRAESGCVSLYTSHENGHNALIMVFITFGVLPLTPNRLVRAQWKYPRKLEWHFPIKPGQVFILYIMNQFVQNGTVNYRRIGPTEIKWARSRGDPEYSGRKKSKHNDTFEFDNQPKFPEFLAQHLRSSCVGALQHVKWGDREIFKDGHFSHLALEWPCRFW